MDIIAPIEFDEHGRPYVYDKKYGDTLIEGGRTESRSSSNKSNTMFSTWTYYRPKPWDSLSWLYSKITEGLNAIQVWYNTPPYKWPSDYNGNR